MFSQRGGTGDFALCLTPGLAGRNVQGDCLFLWDAYYPDIYHILINTNFPLRVLLLCPLLYFFLSCQWRHTCEYKHQYGPLWINMYCYVYSLLKTAAYCTEGIRLGLRNTPVVTFYWSHWKLHTMEEGCQGNIHMGSKYRDMSWGYGETRGTLHHGIAMGWDVALIFGITWWAL